MGGSSSSQKEVVNEVINRLDVEISVMLDVDIKNIHKSTNVQISETEINTAINLINAEKKDIKNEQIIEAINTIVQTGKLRNSLNNVDFIITGTGNTVDIKQINDSIVKVANAMKSNLSSRFSSEAGIEICTEIVSEISSQASSALDMASTSQLEAQIENNTSAASALEVQQAHRSEEENDAINNMINGIVDAVKSIAKIGGTETKEERSKNVSENLTEIKQQLSSKYKVLNETDIKNRLESLIKNSMNLSQSTTIENVAKLAAELIAQTAITNSILLANELENTRVIITGNNNTWNLLQANLNVSEVMNEVITSIENHMTLSSNAQVKTAMLTVLTDEIASQISSSTSAQAAGAASAGLITALDTQAKQSQEDIKKNKGLGVEELAETVMSGMKTIIIIIAVVAIVAIIGGLWFLFGGGSGSAEEASKKLALFTRK